MPHRTEFTRGTPTTISAIGGDCVTLSIYRDSDARWEVTLFAHLEEAGSRALGKVVTCPRALTQGPEVRVIASASLPGVIKWSAAARCLGAANATPLGLELVAARGMAEPRFVDLEFRRTTVLAGVDGVVQLQSGQRLVSVAAGADTGIEATARVDTDQVMVVPAGRAIRAEYPLNRRGCRLEFVDTVSYLIEVEG